MRCLAIIVLMSLFWASCLNQDYEFKENHPLYVEHKHDHDHAEHSHKHEDGHEHDSEHQHEEGESLDYVDLDSARKDVKRLIWQKPEKVIEILGDLEGKTVADIGAGSGFFTFKLAEYADKVIAIDIDERFVPYMELAKLDYPDDMQSKVDARLAELDDPVLKFEEVDAVILVNTYSYIEDRVAYFKKVAEGMKPGGKLLIVDYKTKRLPEGQGPPIEMRVSADSVENELEEAGYRLMDTDDTTLDYQYIVLVTKP